MTRQTITLDNPTRSRKWGWSYTFHPQPAPRKPYVSGTIATVLKERTLDRTFRQRGGAFVNDVLFYDGKRVVELDGSPLGWTIRNYETRVDAESLRADFSGPMTVTVEVDDDQ